MANPKAEEGLLGIRKYLPEYKSDKHLNYVLIGVPVVAGLTAVGLYCWYRRKKPEKKKSTDSNGRHTREESPLTQANNLKVQGNEAFKTGDYNGAINCYTEAINACPKDQSTDLAVFYQNRAAAHEKLGNWAEVVNDCSAALQMNNKYVKAILRRAKAYEQLEDLESALFGMYMLKPFKGFFADGSSSLDYTAGCFLEEFKNQVRIKVSSLIPLRAFIHLCAVRRI